MNTVEISIQDIFWSLKKHIAWIVAATIVGALGAFIITSYFITPVYSTRVSFCVFAKDREDSGLTNNEIAADASIANTYAILLTSEPVRDAVSEAMGGRVSSAALSGMLSTTRPTNSQVIYVTIQSIDRQLAVDVANTLLEVAPEKLSAIVRGGEMTKVDSAHFAAQVSPNLSSNVTYGFFAGLLLSCAVVIIIAMLDTTIWREEDLERAFDIPILGGVPSMFAQEHSSKHKSGR